MARLWSSGGELNSVTANVEVNKNETPAANSTTTVRSDTYAFRANSFPSGFQEVVGHQFSAANAGGPFYARTYLRIATAPSAENTIIYFSATNLLNRQLWITIDNSRVLRLRDSTGAIGSPSSALSTGVWYRIEMMYDSSGANGTHVAEALIDGVSFASASNRTISDVLSFVLGANGGGEAQTTGDWFFDDIAVNDSTGSFENSYPGEGEVIHLRPNADGDNVDWTASGGLADYQTVDEVTPNDATDFITDATTNHITDLDLDATPAAMASDDTINCVQVGVRFRAGAGTTETFNLRIKASSGGTVEATGNITCSTSTWNTNATAVPRNYQLTLYDLPGASTTAWTKSDLDTTQIGVEDTGGAGFADVSTLWLLVDHKPAAAVGGTTLPNGFMTTNTGFWGAA